MRLLYVVQRYGHEVAGGAELCCRQFATRLAARGHDVDVLTSCATSYVDWANVYRPGTDELDGVAVHRLPVAHPRDNLVYASMDARVVWGRKPVPLCLQRHWMLMQGPLLLDLPGWLERHAAGYDAVVFFTYLYYHTWAGLPVAAGLTPTVLHPTAHDEPPFYLPLFETTFRHPTAFAFLTDEERDLVMRRFGIAPRHSVVGVGADIAPASDAGRFRSKYGLGKNPFLLYVGRVDRAKGSDELFDFFSALKVRNPGPLKLVVVGDPVEPLAPHPDIVVTGYVDEQTKSDAYAAALALVQPSYFESFSMVLTEAWSHGTPALVQGHCDVLAGQARRAGGGIPYHGFAEFEAAVELLLGDPALCDALGERGRRYVERTYAWDAVLDRYETLLGEVGRVGAGLGRIAV